MRSAASRTSSGDGKVPGGSTLPRWKPARRPSPPPQRSSPPDIPRCAPSPDGAGSNGGLQHRPQGHPDRRPRVVLRVVPRSSSVVQAEDALDLAVTVLVLGTRPSVSSMQVEAFLVQEGGMDEPEASAAVDGRRRSHASRGVHHAVPRRSTGGAADTGSSMGAPVQVAHGASRHPSVMRGRDTGRGAHPAAILGKKASRPSGTQRLRLVWREKTATENPAARVASIKDHGIPADPLIAGMQWYGSPLPLTLCRLNVVSH